jgi:hypothetical protein
MKDMENFAPQNPMGQAPDFHKQFLSEKEYLMLLCHKWEREDCIERYLKKTS